MLHNKETLITQIDYEIKNIWKKNIATDYNEDFLLLEDCLKCSFYYHLRRKLSKLLTQNDIRIFTEYHVPNTNKRADIAIVHVDFYSDDHHLKHRVDDILAIIELKYDGGNTLATQRWIKSDIAKMKSYIKEDKIPCQYYLAVIYETECFATNWLDRRSVWANDYFTELSAALIDEEMVFEGL